MPLADYVNAFRRLRVNPGSPHKPVMLLAVIQLFENGRITENRIEYNQELLDAYRALFHVIAKPGDHPNPYFPFFHLRNDGGKARFWHLIPLPGRELFLEAVKSARSRRDIEQNVSHVSLAPELFLLLKDPLTRASLKDDLFNHWFSFQRQQLEAAMTQESRIAAYVAELRETVDQQRPPRIAADVAPQTRDPAFARVVRDAYDYRCSASGWRIILPDGAAMVEAAHLIPFSEIQDDDPRNGIALAPTFHWALDRYLIAPGPDMKWHVSNALDRRIRDNAELLEFDGKELLLPRNKKYWPKPESLEWRRANLLS